MFVGFYLFVQKIMDVRKKNTFVDFIFFEFHGSQNQTEKKKPLSSNDSTIRICLNSNFSKLY